MIGSDQAAAADGRLLTKPGTHEAAVAQLTYCSGRSAVFHTGLAVVCKNRDLTEVRVVDVEVKFRALDSQQIERYLTTEQPYDCAGSFKVEGLGISLFEAVRSDDPTSLEGLPLIALTSLLKKTDIEIP